MYMFKVWRVMLKKPLPRVLFSYVYGSAAISLLIFFFAPIPLFWKQCIAVLLAMPYAVGIPLIEVCLLYRERRVKRFLKLLWKVIPIFVLMTVANYFLSPKHFWAVFPGCVFVLFSSSLYGSWAGRMINLGYCGDISEAKSQ